MRKDFGVKAWLYPQMVLIIGTYDVNGKANAMNAAWGGMYDYDKVVIALSKHQTTENLKVSKAFSLSFGTKETVVASDYVGVVSGLKEPNKIEKAGLTVIKSNKVNAPLFEEFPLALECEVEKFDEDEGVLIGKIINVSADESIIENGKINTDKLNAIVFDPINAKYRVVKEAVADAFKVGFTIK